MGLQADIGAGLASALATATGTQCEYVAIPTLGANESRGWVMPDGVTRLRRFEDTAQSRFGYAVTFDLLDRSSTQDAVTVALEGIADSLGEVNMATLFAAITDGGSNIQASTLFADFGTPTVLMSEQAQDGSISGDVDRPRIAVDVAIECWHTNPLT